MLIKDVSLVFNSAIWCLHLVAESNKVEKNYTKHCHSPHNDGETEKERKKSTVAAAFVLYIKVKLYLDTAEPIGKVTEPFGFAFTLTITVPSTNGANPGKNLFK